MAATSPRDGGPGWRHRWWRVPAQQRAPAAGALGDLFRPTRSDSPLLWVLAVSLVVHGALVASLPKGRTQELELTAAADSYLRRVIQKERARHVAADLSRRPRMLPPPPDPEAFVSQTLSTELTKDLSQVTSGLLDVQLEESLTRHVRASLADELKEASRRIATGTLSAEEIQELQRRFKQRTMDVARVWREDHREEYQVEIAARSVTEWYEEKVASQIRWIVQSALFTGRVRTWDRRFGSPYDAPGFIEEDKHQAFVTKYERLSQLAGGRFGRGHFGKNNRPRGLEQCKDAGGGWMQIPGWPDRPGEAQAEILGRLLEDYGRGWEAAFDQYVHDYYPHRQANLQAPRKEIAALWELLGSRSEEYRRSAERGAPAGELREKLQQCLATLKELNAAWCKLLVGREKRAAYHAVNQAVRSRVLRGPFRETAYRRTIEVLVERLRPPIEQLAEGQFREGMVLSEKGVHEAMKQFRVRAVALLKRDMEKTISRPFFYRKLFDSSLNPYRHKLTNESGPPDDEQVAADEAALRKTLEKLPEAGEFAEARVAKIQEEILGAISAAVDEMLEQILTQEGRLKREYYARADTVDYSDPFQHRLEARDMAWKGRGQDLADLTEEGVPDTSSPLVALASGAGRGQIGLAPVVATMQPAYFHGRKGTAGAVRASRPVAPPPASEWGFATQAEVPRPFADGGNFEAIPFLINFPNLDGDLTDWGRVRPLVLGYDNVRDPDLKTGPMLVYAAWNYQGFFFGYRVEQPRIKFSLPSQYRIGPDGVALIKDPRISECNKFVARGDFFVAMFDTLDARLPFRGDPHAQEFYILPRGTATDPDLPGADRTFASRRHGQTDGNFGWGRRICHGRLFPPQPRAGPDGTGPYRVTRLENDGYTVEVFLPRSVFKVPVFAPGWYVGFDCYVGTGKQPSGSGARYAGKGWANRTSWPCSVGNNPSRWGDLLLLGTDARVTVQDAAAGWPRSTAVVPGHSYLVTVADPDRNVHLTSVDTVLVSAEVIRLAGDPGAGRSATDVELYVLKETGANTSIFQGCVDTQPGMGSKVRGCLEVLPGCEVRLGYVDFADAKGRRNVVYEQKLPVVSPTLDLSRAGP